jgi:hypothetical protein
MRSVLIFVIVGCGSAPTPPPVQPTPQRPPPVAPAPAGPPSVEVVCDHLMALEQAKCGGFGTTFIMKRDACLAGFGTTPPNPHDAKQQLTIERCVVDPRGCDAVTQCLSALDDADRSDLRACTDKDDGRAVGVPAAEYAQHNGGTIVHYRDVVSTKDAPIERCGIADANKWLEGLACADGSHPLASAHDAETMRIGNVGDGGRCNSIIDQYRVTCPDAATDIFIDAYVCPRP